MNWKRYVLAIAIASVAAIVADVLINAVVMRGAFVESAKFWLPTDELNRRVPLGFAALVGGMLLFGVPFARLGGRGIRRGLEYGTLLGLASATGVLGLFSLVPWPAEMIFSMAIQQIVNSMLLGLSLGWLYRPN